MSLTAAQLEHLNTVAVQMLDPIVVGPSSPAGEEARHQAISDRLDACATVANELQLHAFSAIARLVAQTHIDSGSTNGVDKIESWIELAVAFCAGQLHGSAADALGAAHPAIGAMTPDASFGQQLRDEALRLMQAQQQREENSLADSEIGGDELEILAQACAELKREVASLAQDQEAGLPYSLIAERIGYVANAVRYMGLEPLASLFDHLIGQLQKTVARADTLDARHSQALTQWPGRWEQWFRSRSLEDLESALATHSQFDWAAPQLVAQARAVLTRLQFVGSRRDERLSSDGSADITLADLSLSIPDDTDHEVVENLLQELPQLTGEFTAAIAGVSVGKLDRLPAALRTAHSIKGVANTVGVVGVANLTHALEDLLQLSVQSGRKPAPAIVETLCEAADCLSEMVESVGGLGAVPSSALSTYQQVLNCVNQIADEQESGGPDESEPDIGTKISPTRMHDAEPAESDAADESDEYDEPDMDSSEDGRIPLPSISLAEFDLPDLSLGSPSSDAGEYSLGQPGSSFADSDDDSPGLQIRVPVLGESDDDAGWSNWSSGSAFADQPGEPVPPPPEAMEAEASEPEDHVVAEPDIRPTSSTLRVNAAVVDRLLESSDEAVIAVSELQEAVKDVGAAHRALRADSDRLDGLSVELDRLIDSGPAAAGLSNVAGGQLDALEMERFTEMHTVSRRITEVAADNKVIEQQIGLQLDRVHGIVDKLDRVQSLIRDGALRARMVEAATIAPRLQRAARQAARIADKQIKLTFRGGESAVYGETLQLLVDSLAHLVRNAVDHGVESSAARQAAGKPETGEITVTFEREVSGVTVVVEDDGAGLDMAAIEQRARSLGLLPDSSSFDVRAAAQLILAPGFTTRSNPSQLSGRGVGLDVVNQAVRGLHGVISVQSEPRAGTRFELSLPLQLTSLSAFVFRAETHVLALSVRGIEKILSDTDAVEVTEQGISLAWKGGRLPLRRLDEVLGLPPGMLGDESSTGGKHDVILVVKQPAGDPGAVLVPEPGQAREVVVRAVPEYLPRVAGIDGVTILGDGAVAPVVDLPEMLAATAGARPDPRRLGRISQPLPVCLVVDDSVSVRRAMAHFMLDLGLVCETAADGHEALQMISRHVPDIVVIDLEMPRVNGLEVTQALRQDKRTQHLPIVMITSRHSEKHRAMAMTAGVTVFLTKPYTEDQLASIVGSCLAS